MVPLHWIRATPQTITPPPGYGKCTNRTVGSVRVGDSQSEGVRSHSVLTLSHTLTDSLSLSPCALDARRMDRSSGRRAT
eukprot:2435791-Prymnesium_polylepis.1